MHELRHPSIMRRPAEPPLIAIPYHLPIFAEYFTRLEPDIDGFREAWITQATRHHFQALPYPTRLSPDAAIPIRLLGTLEEALCDALQAHSAYYWLHLYRRIAPRNAFRDSLISTVALYRRTLEIAFFKYGSENTTDEFVTGATPEKVLQGRFVEIFDSGSGSRERLPEAWYLARLTFEDFLDLQRIECLGHEYYCITSILRWLYKDSPVFIENPMKYRAEPDPQTGRLARDFDRRSDAYGALSSAPGIPISSRAAGLPRNSVLMPFYNIEGRSAAALGYQTLLDIAAKDLRGVQPNFALASIDAEYYRSNHAFLNDTCHSKCGFSIDDLAEFAIAVSHALFYGIMTHPPTVRWGMLQLAYAHGTLDSFVYNWHQILKAAGSSVGEDTLRRISHWTSYDSSSRARISLWTRGPSRLIMPLRDDHVVVDYCALPYLLTDVVTDLRDLVTNWAPKGQSFEDLVALVAEHSPGARIWQRHQVLRAHDGSSREIDVGVMVDDVLYLVDCYTLSRSVAFDQGRREALAFRRARLEAKLAIVDSLAACLGQHPEGVNYQLPQSIRTLIPLVASPFVEYIWSEEAGLWVTESIPRIAAVRELERLFRRKKYARQASTRPFAVSVGGSRAGR